MQATLIRLHHCKYVYMKERPRGLVAWNCVSEMYKGCKDQQVAHIVCLGNMNCWENEWMVVGFTFLNDEASSSG